MSTRSKHAQRVLETIRKQGRPLSAEEVRELLSETGVGQATVYRILNAAADEGLLQRVDLPNEPGRYEPADLDHHHHFQCDQCGKVFDIQGCPGDLAGMLPEGFSLRSHDITLRGTCGSCDET
ncbi:MAG: transcriptional repressor [Planctomycetota bacterium]